MLFQMKNRNLLKIAENEIDNRGLSTPAGWETLNARVIDKQKDFFVITNEYKYHYSRRFGDWWVSASYLIGIDENQLFAVRVPGSIKTVNDAIAFITPNEAKKAKEKGFPVVRQGDFFFVPKRIKENDFSALKWSRHTIKTTCTGEIIVMHPQHAPKKLSNRYIWRAYRAKQSFGVNAD